MVAKVLITEQDGAPPQICFADHATDFSPTAANSLEVGTPTDVQLDLTSLANGAYRQSAKVDLGANRAGLYAARAALEFATGPTAGNRVNLYWAPSGSATAGTGNPAAASGSDAAYAGYSSNAAASVLQAVFIGSFVCTAQATTTVQVAECGALSPTERYGSLIVENASGVAMMSDAVEMHIVLDPVVEEIQ